MNKEIEDALHTLLHCSLKDTEYETQKEQFKIVYDYKKKLQQENKQLKEEIRKMKNAKSYKILKEWEEFIEHKEFNNYTDFEYKMKLIELKEKYK